MGRKTYILDTNVLIHDPESMFCFQDNEVVIPFEALEELDKLKKRYDHIGHNARQTIRHLGTILEKEGPSELLMTKDGGVLRLDSIPFRKINSHITLLYLDISLDLWFPMHRGSEASHSQPGERVAFRSLCSHAGGKQGDLPALQRDHHAFDRQFPTAGHEGV